jgi:hypothetical protein
VKTPITIVELGRLGDIMNVLPIAKRLHSLDHPITWVAHEDFTNILDGCQYVNRQRPWFGSMEDVAGAIKFAGQFGGEVLATQVYRNPLPVVKQRNFTMESWQRAGDQWPSLFHELPLVFDNRDRMREQQLFVELMMGPPLRDSRPILLYALEGISSPYPHTTSILKLLKPWQAVFRIVNLCTVRAHRFYDFMGIYEKAAGLISIDTSFLHLSHATKVPTIALLNNNPYLASEPRDHWKGHMSYSRSASGPGLAAIQRALQSIAGVKSA